MAVPPLGATGLDTSDPATFGTGSGMMAPSSMGASEGFRDEVSQNSIDLPTGDTGNQTASGLTESTALSMLRDASSQSRSFFESFVHRSWNRNYKAYRNEHFDGSIYLRDEYRTRSKIFKPKTRSALRKQLATTAKALFSTGDVVSVQAEDDTNQQQVQSALLKQEIISYRLSNTTLRNGIPWFLTASGARFDAQMTGLCCSKQFWNYKEIDTGENETVDALDENGQPTKKTQPKILVLIDKPDALLLSPENVRFDPNAPWVNVAQLSPYLILQFPMTPADAFDMIQQNAKAKIPWKSISLKRLNELAGDQPTETTSPRSAREGGRDPIQQASGASRNVWLTEVFMRYQGRDYVFWAIRDTEILSTPIPVEKAYPAFSGERPVTIGMGQLEPHRAYQQSAVESWQQTQQEINDSANLRLDHLKQIVSPPMKVLRGKKVDLAQVQRKAQNAIIMVNSMEDVEPMAMPDTPGSAFQEASIMNSDMDDLAGNFDSSSVQTNRDLNETVGGMHLLSEASNQVSDFDLSVWSETWAQPTVVQILKLEEYYESDEKVLALCGQRAKLWERFGTSHITDELLQSETSVKLNLGIGATSLPMERLKRFSVAWDTAAKALSPFVTTKVIEIIPDAEVIVNDIFSAGGFRDGGSRFFKYIGPMQQPSTPPPPDPKVMAVQAKQEANQIAQEKNQSAALIEAHKLQDSRAELKARLLSDAQSNRTALDIAHLKAMASMHQDRTQQEHEGTLLAHTHAHGHLSEFVKNMAQHLAPQPQGGPGGLVKGGSRNNPNPNVPLLASIPSPHLQQQAGLYANLSDSLHAADKL